MSDLNSLTPGTWTVDPAHSGLNFSVKHLMVSKVRGKFRDFSGVITIAPDRLQSSVIASARVDSIDTGDENRDGHLKSGDFFDAASNPTIDFRSTTIEAADGAYRLLADLTIKGVTRSVAFDLEFDGVNTDPWGNTKAGFTATAEINRRDWGLEYNAVLETGGVLIGEKVRIELDIQVIKA